VKQIEVSLNPTTLTGHEAQCIFMIISRWINLKVGNISGKIV